MNGLFDKTIGLLHNSLDLRAARQKLLSSNIANQETPGYRAVDIKFEEELKKRDGGALQTMPVTTSPRHIAINTGTASDPRVIDRATDIESYDKNSVGIEGEMVKLSDNALMYAVSSKMLREKFGMLMTAIKEGGK